jgi:hypothetical protein
MVVSDALPESLPTWQAARQTLGANALAGAGVPALGPGNLAQRLVELEAGEGYRYSLFAGGSLLESRFYLPDQASVEAGRDIENVQLDLQNLEAGDKTVVRAGRDIRYNGLFRSGARFANGGGYIRVGGPGELLVQAGRHVNLGTSSGIDAQGNLVNLSLQDSKSADLTVIAGYSGRATAQDYDTLFKALKAAGIGRDKEQGEAAIAKVFNEDNTGPGDITMFFSQIKTQGNSRIDLLAPQGNINAGLPTPQQGDIGVITFQGGDIRSYLRGDFNVNQSKVLTLQGGDIMIYSSRGNIDAGRGALDSRTTQPPRRITDPVSGLTFFQPPVDASGSGIRTVSSDADGPGPLAAPKPGDVYLFAPSGFIDAGEAGVSSAGNIFVVALQVINAANFSAAGSSVGVPAASSGGISAGMNAASNVGASAAKSAEDVTKSLASASPAALAKDAFRPSFISVEVLGIGEEGSTN